MPQTTIIPYGPASVFDPLVPASAVALRTALVRPQNPPPGVAGFLFDIDEDSMVEMASDITDHFVENNTALQDHIANRPVEIETNGCVGELVAFPDNSLSTIAATNAIPDALPDNADITPELTPEAQQNLDLSDAVDASANAGVADTNSLAGYFGVNSPQPPQITRQSNALLYFYQLRQARILFSVETPWGFWNNMAIQNISVKQGRESKFQSDFSVRFKQISIAESPAVTLGNLAGRAAGNAAAEAPTAVGTMGSAPFTVKNNRLFNASFVAP